MLEVGELGAGAGGGGFAGVKDFGAEFGAGGAEEVGFLWFLFRGLVWPNVGFWVGWVGRCRRVWGGWGGRKGGGIYVFDVRF